MRNKINLELADYFLKLKNKFMFSFIKSIFDKFNINLDIKKSGHKAVIKDSIKSPVFQAGRDIIHITNNQKEEPISDLERRILKRLYAEYKKTGKRLSWKTIDAHKELGVKDGDYVGILSNSPYIELVGEHYQIKDEGIRLMDKNIDSALVTCEIASVLPNTIHFNFLKDGKVWFSIKNHDTKKYRAYVKIKFISDDYEEEVKEGYYGGTKAWNLNEQDGIVAPGLDIPPEIREKIKQKKKIEIRIFCEIKDENDELIEKKLPVGYVYDYENNNWYYEP